MVYVYMHVGVHLITPSHAFSSVLHGLLLSSYFFIRINFDLDNEIFLVFFLLRLIITEECSCSVPEISKSEVGDRAYFLSM